MLLFFPLNPDNVTIADTEETLDVKENKMVPKSNTAKDDLHVETQVIGADKISNHKHVTDKEISVHNQADVKELVEAPICNTEKSKHLLLHCQ